MSDVQARQPRCFVTQPQLTDTPWKDSLSTRGTSVVCWFPRSELGSPFLTAAECRMFQENFLTPRDLERLTQWD